MTDFRRFLERRAAIEQRLEDEPSLIEDKELRKAYETLWRKTHDLRTKWAKKVSKDWVEQKVAERQKDLEVFRSTSRDVDALWEKLATR